MQSVIIAPVKFDTPTKRTRPEDTTSSSARMVSSNGVEASGQCTSRTSTQSVRSRFRLRSISRRMLARLESRSGPSWPRRGAVRPLPEQDVDPVGAQPLQAQVDLAQDVGAARVAQRSELAARRRLHA